MSFGRWAPASMAHWTSRARMPLQLQTYKAFCPKSLLRMTLHSMKSPLCNSFATASTLVMTVDGCAGFRAGAEVWLVNRKSRPVPPVSFT